MHLIVTVIIEEEVEVGDVGEEEEKILDVPGIITIEEEDIIGVDGIDGIDGDIVVGEHIDIDNGLFDVQELELEPLEDVELLNAEHNLILIYGTEQEMKLME